MTDTKRIRQAIFELFIWRKNHGTATNFTARLFELIAKADVSNKNRLRRAFPEEVAAYDLWQEATNEATFFRSWDVHGDSRAGI